MTHEVTSEHFPYFFERCKFYKEFFDLSHLFMKVELVDGESMDIMMELMDDEPPPNASWNYNYSGSSFVIQINTEIEGVTGDIKRDLDEIAFHEVFEAGVLGQMLTIAKENKNKSDCQEIERIGHEILYRTKNALKKVGFKQYIDNYFKER